jgi:hypothetical protein
MEGDDPPVMTEEEHRQRHVMLHAALEELAADWAAYHARQQKERAEPKLFSNSTIMELMEWSCQQTKRPEGPHTPRHGMVRRAGGTA